MVFFSTLFRTVSNLYEDPNWSQKDLARPIHEAKKHLTKSKISIFSLEHLIHYQTELRHRAEEGIPVSFSDLWAVALENVLHDKVCNCLDIFSWLYTNGD